jgi:hypothetical protein
VDGRPRIDDSVDAAYAAWTEDPANVAGETALSILSAFFPPAAAFKAVKDQFSSEARFGRVLYLVRALVTKVNLLESQVNSLPALSKAVKDAIESAAFKAAVSLALEESARTADTGKIDQFSSVLAASVDPRIMEDSPADASTLIRDIAQLSAIDLLVLRLLEETYGDLFPAYPNVHDPNVFTEKFQDFKDAIRRSGLHPEEFQSVCERLRGFGLAAEVSSNPSRMSLPEYCYRPTRRGLKLLRLLKSSSVGTESSPA